MNYYYADSKNEPIGPRTQEQMQQLHRTGKLRDDSWVLVEGAKEWSRYASVFPPEASPTSHEPNASGLPPIIVPQGMPPVIQQKKKSSTFSVARVMVGLVVGVILLLAVPFVMRVIRYGGFSSNPVVRLSKEELNARIAQYIGEWRCEQNNRVLEILKDGSWSVTRPPGRMEKWWPLRDGTIIMESTGALTADNGQELGTTKSEDRAWIQNNRLHLRVSPSIVFTYKKL